MDEALGLAVDATGIYLAGMTNGLFVDQRAGFTDALVIKLLNPVSIDVIPGDPLNVVNQRSRLMGVAILSNTQFDATRVDPRSVCFGDARSPETRTCAEVHSRGHIEDVNRDGRPDMMLHYEVAATGVNDATLEVCLLGATLEGVPFKGCGPVSVR